jgi:hypothetical protein
MGALLVSMFNVEWGCNEWAGGVEVLEFCLQQELEKPVLAGFSCQVYLQSLSKILL